MEEAQQQIVECKLELQEAKQIRKHRQGLFCCFWVFLNILRNLQNMMRLQP